MSEDNYSENNEMKMITNQVWKSMSLLRGVIPVEHHHVYLFLLSAYHDEVIKSVHIDFSNDLYDYIFSSLKNEQRYSEIMDVYRPIIKSIPEERINEVLHHFTMFDDEILHENFDEIFDDLLFRLADNQGKYSGEFLLPNEISKFVMELAEIPNQASVFNPFAGLASFATYLKNNERYYGQEIATSTWALGMLRLMRHNKYAQIDYRVEDSINNWPDFKNFDLVISSPPFNYKINSHIAHQFGRKRMNAETYVIKKGLETINFDGKVACVISQGLLFRGGDEQKLRQYLVEEGLIETIVSLPGGILKHTGIPICVMILTRKKNSDGIIRIIDASSFVENRNKREKRLEVGRLLDHLYKFNRSEAVVGVTIDQVRDNNYNLNVQRYLVEEFNGTPLFKLVTPLKGKRVGKKNMAKGKFVRTSNLKDNDVSYELNLNDIKERELPSHSIKIESNCILISTRWKSLKPTLFVFKGEPIFIGLDLLPIKILSNNFEVDPHYLISELRSSKVLKQVAAFQNPGAITSLSRADFFGMKIELPTIEEQQAKIKGILELSERFKLLQLERNALAHGKQLASFNEFASLKHSLGTPRQNILSNAKSLIRFFENNNSDAFKEVKELYSKRYDTNLIDDLVQIKDDVNHISTILEKGENGLLLENYELKSTPIQEVDKALKAIKRDRENYKPQYKEPPSTEIAGKAVKINITLFKVLINNVLSNADRYAFDSRTTANELIIELKATENNLELEIRNNGKPFPKNFDKDKFITKFTTTSTDKGSGLGGYDINRIAKYFDNPEWELELNSDEIFPVTFRFSFPITPMINE
jgi:type I restriction-modification system DNA methylase subunit